MERDGFTIIVARIQDASTYVSHIWCGLPSSNLYFIYYCKCCDGKGQELWDICIHCALKGKTCDDEDCKRFISCRRGLDLRQTRALMIMGMLRRAVDFLSQSSMLQMMDRVRITFQCHRRSIPYWGTQLLTP